MLQITKTGLSATNNDLLERLRDQFSINQSLRLSAFIDGSIVDQLTTSIDTAKFLDTNHLDSKKREFAKDFTIDGGEIATHMFHLVLNNANLFKVIEQITDCPSIGGFSGRIYRSISNADHHLSWHDDNEDPRRLIGISVNFSRDLFSGGVFQLREKKSKKILTEIANTELGSAMIFRVSSELEHRITRIEGDKPRTAGAGWFSSVSDYLPSIKSRGAKNQTAKN